MKVKWLGHSAFLITSAKGVRIITDPYATGMGINYGPIKEDGDIVLVSHDHRDHNNVGAIAGHPQVVKGVGDTKAGGLVFKGVATFHDDNKGRQRGPNTVFRFAVDDIVVCFAGDLGHMLDKRQLSELGEVDLLLIPVGGFYTIDAASANELCDAMKPRVVNPMHFKTDKCGYPIAGVEEFAEGRSGVTRLDGSEVEFRKETLPLPTRTIVLQHAL